VTVWSCDCDSVIMWPALFILFCKSSSWLKMFCRILIHVKIFCAKIWFNFRVFESKTHWKYSQLTFARLNTWYYNLWSKSLANQYSCDSAFKKIELLKVKTLFHSFTLNSHFLHLYNIIVISSYWKYNYLWLLLILRKSYLSAEW